MVLALIRKTPEIAPLIVIVGTASLGAIAFGIRQATKNPEAVWDKKNNPHPWLNIKQDEQVKLYSHTDYSKLDKTKTEAEK
ncbi:hypothetical protein ACROYT_G026076 [Oculina patagonica]